MEAGGTCENSSRRRSMMKRSRVGVCGALIVMLWAGTTLTGCGRGAASHYGSASIVSEPPDATVVNLEDGSTIGSTPLQYTWETGEVSEKYIQLRLNSTGYEDQVAEFFLNSRHGSKEGAEETPQTIHVKMKKAE
jgi:hypothetical protein